MTITIRGIACLLLAFSLISCSAVDRILPGEKQTTGAAQTKSSPPPPSKVEPAKLQRPEDNAEPAAGSAGTDPAPNLLSPGDAEAAPVPTPATEKNGKRKKTDASIFDSF